MGKLSAPSNQRGIKLERKEGREVKGGAVLYESATGSPVTRGKERVLLSRGRGEKNKTSSRDCVKERLSTNPFPASTKEICQGFQSRAKGGDREKEQKRNGLKVNCRVEKRPLPKPLDVVVKEGRRGRRGEKAKD